MSVTARTIPTHTWHGCYDAHWRGLIVPESFAHPAKFARGLIERILRHGFDRGWWRAGDLVGDPFGGVALGGVAAGYAGLNWVGCELEGKFVLLGNRNLALHGPKWMVLGQASCVTLLQGDSRRFASIIEGAGAIITSPPYADNQRSDRTAEERDRRRGFRQGSGCFRTSECYGRSDGQIGALGSGNVDAIVSSPPYADGLGHGGGRPIHQPGRPDTVTLEGQKEGYGGTAGQIGALPAGGVDAVVTSPPYADSVNSGNHGIDWSKCDAVEGRRRGDGTRHEAAFRSQMAYGVADGQIGALSAGGLDAVLTSPPYEGTDVATADARDGKRRLAQIARAIARGEKVSDEFHRLLAKGINPASNLNIVGYGRTEGQIGADTGETYWQAMHLVYGQCLLALKPGGVMCVVVKDYVKDRQRVPLCDQTLRLLEHLGFEPVERIRAMLVRERRHTCLFGHEHLVRKERKSFFRRLAEKKGSPRIDWEEVLVVRKPGGAT